MRERGGEWEHCKFLFENGFDILESGISNSLLIDGLLLLEGWILPQYQMDTVQVFVNDVYVGNAQMGMIRNDIRKKFPVFNNEKCGFCLESVVKTEETNMILIKVNIKGKIIWEMECKAEEVGIDKVITDLLQKKEYQKLRKVVYQYSRQIGDINKIKEPFNNFLNTLDDCYEKINICQLIYQLGFFDGSYMKQYIEEIEKIDDIWTKLWLREQDIPWMLFHYPQFAIESIYVWERRIMEQIAKEIRKDKGMLQNSGKRFDKEHRVAIIVEGLADETAASSIFQIEIANILAQRMYNVTIFVLDTSYFENDLKTHSTVQRKRNSCVNRDYHLRASKENVEIWYGQGNSLKEKISIAIDAIEMQKPEFIIDISLGGTVVAAIFQESVSVIHIPLTGYSSGAVFDGYIAKSKLLCAKENEFFHSIEESKICEAAINIPYHCKQNKIYYREDFGFQTDDFILVTVGNRLKYEMDIDFVKTVQGALKENPRYKWIIVGNDLGEEIYRAVDELVKLGQIKLWGFENDLVALYKICNVYLNPNRMGGCGSMELAMALKLPIALTDVPSDILPVIMEENCCGSGYKDIIRYIEKLYITPSFYQEESEKFYLLIQRKELSMEHYVEVILEAYERAVKNK